MNDTPFVCASLILSFLNVLTLPPACSVLDFMKSCILLERIVAGGPCPEESNVSAIAITTSAATCLHLNGGPSAARGQFSTIVAFFTYLCSGQGVFLALCAPIGSIVTHLTMASHERSPATASTQQQQSSHQYSPRSTQGLKAAAAAATSRLARMSSAGASLASAPPSVPAAHAGVRRTSSEQLHLRFKTMADSVSEAAAGMTAAELLSLSRPFSTFGLELSALDPTVQFLEQLIDRAIGAVSSTVMVVAICLPIGGQALLRILMARIGHKVIQT